jgi:hypothetical protein
VTDDLNRDLNRFAELLIHQVRDQPIRICDRLAAGRMHGPDGERWRSVLADRDARAAVTELIPDIVDQVLAHLLNALDQGDLPLAWRGTDGECVDLYDLGRSEMAGWLFGDDYDSWQETVYLPRSPENARRLMDAVARQGRAVWACQIDRRATGDGR